jgi:homeobox protein cut-like
VELAQQQLDYERQVDQGRRELREASTRLDALQSELFAHKQRSGLAKSALDAEIEAISQEAIMMQTLRLENGQLKKQIEELLSVSPSGPSIGSGSLSTPSNALELSQKDVTIASLRQEIFRLKEEASRAEDAAAKATERFEDSLQQAKRTHDDLLAQLAARPTMEKYNDVLHQLRVLQQLEYNIVEEAEDDVVTTSAGGSSSEADGTQSSSDIEKVLVARVRRLEHALQQRDLALQEKTADLEKARADLQVQMETIRDQKLQLHKLEETIDALESRRLVGGKPQDVGSEILLDAVEDNTKTGTTAAGAGGTGADSKMFEIVRGQRDRFRDRMKELQAEKNKMEELTTGYQSQVARLENDNMQLYQKIRYLQSYQTGGSSRGKSMAPGGTGGTASMRVAPGLVDLEGGGIAEVESRYKSMYDEKMNPFQQFNKIESQQRYTNLNTVDKILLNSAKLFLGHRITRNFAFGYILLLHFLVFSTLYTFMHGCGITNDN